MLPYDSACAAAGCQRTIIVASSQVGRAMMIAEDSSVRGAVRDFLDDLSHRTGCTFSYRAVPRARAWMMVEWGHAGIMPAAAQSPARDQFAQFVPTHQVRPMLLTLDKPSSLASSAALAGARLHVGVVRGYDFGPAYRKMADELSRQGKLHVVAEPQAIARLLRSGGIDAAVLPPAAFADAGEASQLAERMQWRDLPEFPRVRIGFYLSSKGLDEGERSVLSEAIRQAVAKDLYGKAMRRHYPPWALQDVQGN